MSLRTTALHALHTELGGRLVDFAGWELPVQFAGGIAEHQHTRTAASLFDVSHMGQVLVRPLSGDLADAAAALESVIPASVAGLAEGRQRYGLLTTQAGGVVDDLMFAHRGDAFLVVLNAARTEVDLGLLTLLDGVAVELLTDRALLALQGPAAAEALARLVPGVTDLTFMDAVTLDWDGAPVWVSRSGYTGEDGFELSVEVDHAAPLWDAIVLAGEVHGLVLAGLAARDTLRLEAGMPLYGHELTLTTYPFQAGLGRVVAMSKPDFVGRDAYVLALEEQSDLPVLVGLTLEGRRAARAGYPVLDEGGEPVGTVTSGVLSPTLGHPIAMAYVPPSMSQVGTRLAVDVRSSALPAVVVDLPFYRRPKES